MRSLLVVTSAKPGLSEIVSAAFRRSFTRGAVVEASVALWKQTIAEGRPFVLVVSDPLSEWAELIRATIIINGSKVIVLGAVPDGLLELLDAQRLPEFSDDERVLFSCPPAEPNNFSESPAAIFYNFENVLGSKSPLQIRSCERFDFMAEWNNLGFTSIKADQSIWAIASKIDIPARNRVAEVRVTSSYLSAYAGLWDVKNSSLLWFNRAVGPVDSQEWLVIEEYVASYCFESSVCLPVISEIPPGYDACVTMRLDCDEDISSAKQLYDLYKEKGVPFSLALHTKVLEDSSHNDFLNAFVADGEGILTHSATHPVNWGGSYEETVSQVNGSVAAIKRVLGDKTEIKYAVSPFHQNPSYAVQGMADAGLTGFIGGIICNDPEYLFARGGEVPFTSRGFISHSQQCMLHGECMLQGGDQLKIFKQSFDIAKKGKSLFGYLDHPFSPRYAYGWVSEDERCNAHNDFINYINASGNVLYLTEVQALDWIALKASVELTLDESDKITAEWNPNLVKRGLPEIRYKNKTISITELAPFKAKVVTSAE
jgi:hypothetical protein